MRPANIQAQRQKEVRQIWKERYKIWKEIHDLPLIKLEHPVRHGWYKEIILTENLDRYKSKPEVEEIFEMFQTYYWGRTKKECEKRWNCQRSKHFIYKDVPTISKKQFNKLSPRAQRLCTPFQYRENKRLRTRFYVRIPHNGYRIKFTRAYNTHRKMIDPVLESRLSLLEARLLKPGIYEANEARDPYSKDYWWKEGEVKRSRINSKQALGKYRNTSARSAIEEFATRGLKEAETRLKF